VTVSNSASLRDNPRCRDGLADRLGIEFWAVLKMKNETPIPIMAGAMDMNAIANIPVSEI